MMTITSLVLSGCTAYISRTDWADINGQHLYYAVEGPDNGRTVLLLHGNGGNHSKLETTQRQLAQAGYLVYALDSRGQGANEELDEYHYADMAEDTYHFVRYMREHSHYQGQPAVFGWSDGGIIALMTESMHPGTFSAIISSGANISCHDYLAPNDWLDTDDPNVDLMSLSPLERMMHLEPEMTAEDMARIQCPTLICAGENDLIKREHTERIAREIPGAELYFVPGHDHGSHIKYNPLMGEILLDYLRKIHY